MRCLPAIAILFAATPALAEVTATRADGFVSRNTVEVSVSPEEAWKALIAPAGWWSSAHTYSGDAANLYLDAQATGCFCELLTLPKGAPEGQRRGSVEHMHIVYSEPFRAMRMQGGLGPLQSEAVHGTLTVTFKATGDKTRILFEYIVFGYMRLESEKMAPLVDKVLSEQLARLAAKLDPEATAADKPAVDAKEEPAKP
jgi:hypothetical protein